MAADQERFKEQVYQTSSRSNPPLTSTHCLIVDDGDLHALQAVLCSCHISTRQLQPQDCPLHRLQYSLFRRDFQQFEGRPRYDTLNFIHFLLFYFFATDSDLPGYPAHGATWNRRQSYTCCRPRPLWPRALPTLQGVCLCGTHLNRSSVTFFSDCFAGCRFR